MLSPLLFVIAMDVILEKAREGLMNKILYADDLILMSESIEEVFKMERGIWKQGAEGQPQENQGNDEWFER